MKIFLLTPVYASTTGKDAATPVVHYFAKEWVKQGHNVTVFHLEPKYLSILYFFSKRFHHQLASLLNFSVPLEMPKDYHSNIEGVDVYGIIYKKYIPHSRIIRSEKSRIVELISNVVNEKGVPDIIIGHWTKPQLDLLPELKDKYHKPTCLVFHSNTFELDKSFGSDFKEKLSKIDILGFRNISAKETFEKRWWKPSKSFIAASGVSDEFISSPRISTEQPFNKFIFVGSLIPRKHPTEVLRVLEKVYSKEDFSMTYVGDGQCKSEIEEVYKTHGEHGTVSFTGRLPRNEVIKHLLQSNVFIMISSSEIFGLVYLEAMALGLIPIGSRGEGIDGIIKDGENGFLCKAGDEEELELILTRLKNMNPDEISRLSNNARITAMEYSDFNVAKKYIKNIESLI
ncbi:glycosyltransferase family 4 protein [Parabacteroides distasonis]|nr:glycosyltransferase family 4 protein [Parabacteroides distasonis]